MVSLAPLSIIFYILADFDGLGEGDSTQYEPMVAKHDSGNSYCFGVDLTADGMVTLDDVILMGLYWLEYYDLDPGEG